MLAALLLTLRRIASSKRRLCWSSRKSKRQLVYKQAGFWSTLNVNDPDDVKEYTGAGVQDFESTSKAEFDLPDSTYYISFRDSKLAIPKLGIRRGRMALDGSTIEGFFDQGVTDVITTVREQMLGLNPKHLLLVGGFGESLYLRRRLSHVFSHHDCQITLIDDPTSKAAADGTAIWAARLAVVGRVTRVSYGLSKWVRYDSADPEHRDRKRVRGGAGYDRVGGQWRQILGKGVVLSARESIRYRVFKSYELNLDSGDAPLEYGANIWVFHGEQGDAPRWIKDINGNVNPKFEQLCSVRANLEDMRSALRRKQGQYGPYDHLEAFLTIQLGGTELSARVEWEEQGTLRSGPASIIPEPVDLSTSGKNVSK